MIELLGMTAILAAAQPAEPPTIVVTGHGLDEASDNKLAGDLALDRAAIERSASRRMEDVLRDVAGLTSFRRSDSRSAHPTSQGLTLRGLGGNAASRVLVTLDGVPQADPFGGWIGFTAFDPHAIERIRVIRGGSGVAGPGALAGRVDVDSRTAEAAEPIELALAAGTRRSLDARLFAGERWSGGFAILSGSFASGDGFAPVADDDRGPADRRSPFRQGSGRARLVQSVGSETEAQLNLSTFADRRERGTAFSDNRQRGIDASVRLVGHGATRWSALAYFQDRRFDSQFASLDPDRTSATLVLDQRVPARGWGARLEAAPKSGRFEMRIGADWRRMSGRTLEDFRFIAGSPTRQREAGGKNGTTGLFGAAHWTDGAWRAEAETRLDRWTIYEGRLVEAELDGALLTDSRFDRRTGWEPSGRIALGRELSSSIQLRAAAYRQWRLPTLNELYRPFRVGADATAANPALDPERLNGIEAGIEWQPEPHSRLSATLFANRLDGAIANVTLGEGPGIFPGVGFVAAGGTFRQRLNVAAIVSRGVELDASYERGPRRGSLSYALTDARLHADGAAAPLDGRRPAQTARHSAAASIDWHRNAAALGLSAHFGSRQYDDDANERRLPAALTLDTRARLQIARDTSVEFRVENLLDRQVITSVAGDGTRERALPRTLWIGLRLR